MTEDRTPAAGPLIKLVRLAMGASRREYADRMGVSTRSLSRWESGTAPVPNGVLDSAYEDLDLIQDTLHLQSESLQLPLASPWSRLPEHLTERGLTHQVWNQCLAVHMIAKDLRGEQLELGSM